MLKTFSVTDAIRGASVVLVIISASLLGQYAARGMTGAQWVYGLTAVAGSIALAVIIRCWPAPQSRNVPARD